MSMLTFGPPVVLDDSHRPVAPPHSLLNTPGVVKSPGDPHWLSGAVVYPYPEDLPGEWDPCSAGTFRTKDDGTGVDSPHFASFVSYLPITCSSISIGDPEEFANRAEIAMNAVQSFSVERQLSQGTGVATNPFLADAAHTLTAAGATATPATAALSYLEETIGATGKQGMIHATPPVASVWFDQTRGTEPLITNLGTRVVSGGGYAGAKRTQWFMAKYASLEAERTKLGLRIQCLLPMLSQNGMGPAAIAAYAERAGIPQEEFAKRLGPPLTPAIIGQAVVDLHYNPGQWNQLAYQIGGDGLTPVS